MSAPPNTVKTTPIAEPVQSDKEEVIVDVLALAQQLREAELRNMRITKRKDDWEAKKKQEEKDKADRLA